MKYHGANHETDTSIIACDEYTYKKKFKIKIKI